MSVAENDARRPGCEMHGCPATAVGIGDIDGDEFWLCDAHHYPVPTPFPPADPGATTVCIAHGSFIPCRRLFAEHRYTDNPYWVKSVRDYHGSTIEGLTWEPAWTA